MLYPASYCLSTPKQYYNAYSGTVAAHRGVAVSQYAATPFIPPNPRFATANFACTVQPSPNFSCLGASAALPPSPAVASAAPAAAPAAYSIATTPYLPRHSERRQQQPYFAPPTLLLSPTRHGRPCCPPATMIPTAAAANNLSYIPPQLVPCSNLNVPSPSLQPFVLPDHSLPPINWVTTGETAAGRLHMQTEKPANTAKSHAAMDRKEDAVYAPIKATRRIRWLRSLCSIEPYYSLGNTLSVCHEGQARPILKEALHNSTRRRMVVKALRKDRLPHYAGGAHLWRKLWHRILNLKTHNNTMSIEDVFECPRYFYIACEKLEGGELFDYLLTENAIPEDTCKHVMRQIVQAVDILHCQNLLHRDIKPENVMFRYSRGSAPLNHHEGLASEEYRKQHELTLIDFDTCKMIDEPASEYKEPGSRCLVGTYGYLAPEIFKGGEYTKASDLWSIGVILYVLMTGMPPFAMEFMKGAKESLAVLSFAEKKGIPFNVSPFPEFPLARDLCIRLLQFDPTRRCSSTEQLLKHPWLATAADTPPASPAIPSSVSSKDVPVGTDPTAAPHFLQSTCIEAQQQQSSRPHADQPTTHKSSSGTSLCSDKLGNTTASDNDKRKTSDDRPETGSEWYIGTDSRSTDTGSSVTSSNVGGRESVFTQADEGPTNSEKRSSPIPSLSSSGSRILRSVSSPSVESAVADQPQRDSLSSSWNGATLLSFSEARWFSPRDPQNEDIERAAAVVVQEESVGSGGSNLSSTGSFSTAASPVHTPPQPQCCPSGMLGLLAASEAQPKGRFMEAGESWQQS